MATKFELKELEKNYTEHCFWLVFRNGKQLKDAQVCELGNGEYQAAYKNQVAYVNSLDASLKFIQDIIALRRKPFKLYYNGIEYTQAALIRLAGEKWKVDNIINSAKNLNRNGNNNVSEWYFMEGILTVSFNK